MLVPAQRDLAHGGDLLHQTADQHYNEDEEGGVGDEDGKDQLEPGEEETRDVFTLISSIPKAEWLGPRPQGGCFNKGAFSFSAYQYKTEQAS